MKSREVMIQQIKDAFIEMERVFGGTPKALEPGLIMINAYMAASFELLLDIRDILAEQTQTVYEGPAKDGG